jgi:hypothetical protein
MIVTEKEAAEKWCPFARVIEHTESGNIVPPSNRTVLPDGDSDEWRFAADAPCVGSLCMSWRWNITPADAERYRSSMPMTKDFHEANGYCGLAGKVRS